VGLLGQAGSVRVVGRMNEIYADGIHVNSWAG